MMVVIFDWRGEASESLVVWDQLALTKSVNKLLLAASASKGCFIVVTWYFMFAVELTSGFELLRGSHRWFSRPFYARREFK